MISGECLLLQALKISPRRRVGEHETRLGVAKPRHQGYHNVAAAFSKRAKLRGEIGLLPLNRTIRIRLRPNNRRFPSSYRSPPAEYAVFHYHRFGARRGSSTARPDMRLAAQTARTIAKRLGSGNRRGSWWSGMLNEPTMWPSSPT
jgi:hypothetical protein